MTNKIAIFLGLAILLVVALDTFVFHWDLHIFIGRKLLDLISFIAFWR